MIVKFGHPTTWNVTKSLAAQLNYWRNKKGYETSWMQKGWQRATLNSLKDDEQELWKYVIGHKRNDYGIK
jgi:hypothetical protein